MKLYDYTVHPGSLNPTEQDLFDNHDVITLEVKRLAEVCATQAKRAMVTQNYYAASVYSRTMSDLLRSYDFLQKTQFN